MKIVDGANVWPKYHRNDQYAHQYESGSACTVILNCEVCAYNLQLQKHTKQKLLTCQKAIVAISMNQDLHVRSF